MRCSNRHGQLWVCTRGTAEPCQNRVLFQTPAGHSVFDIPFFVLECAGAILFIVAVGKPAAIPNWLVRLVSVLLIVILPVVWATLFPHASGIEGATRLILAVPLVATNIMLAFAAYLRTRKR